MSKAEAPKLTAIAPWFGGKRTLAPAIVQELGPHEAYFEPCCGSLAALFAKPVTALETVSDLHGDLINLAMCLASRQWHDLYEAVDRILLDESLIKAFHKSCKYDFGPPADPDRVRFTDIDRAARYLAMCWIGRNGVAGTARSNYQVAARWTQGGGSPGIRWRAAVDSVPAWHDRLKGVTILHRDLFQIVPKIEDEVGVAIYVDPPYFARTLSGASRYLHGFTEAEADLLGCEDDHTRLARELLRFKSARIVVSYYDDPRLDDLYVRYGWTKRTVFRHKNLHTQNKRGSTRSEAPEVLLLNGPSNESDGRGGADGS